MLVAFIVNLLFFIVYKGYKNTQNIVINNVSINTKQNEHPYRVLHISDMHLENISITPEQLYESLRDQPIDLIALTGDFLDRKRSIPKLIPYLKVFNKLKPRHGTYAVFGNHDYVLSHPNFLKLKQVLEEYGCKTMQNENDVLMINGKPLNIIGIDDFSTKRSDIHKSFKGLANGYNLVLTHDPNIVLRMKDVPFDYLISGHFHGGQIHWPKPYHLVKMGKLVRMNMVKGLHHHDGKPFYISEGLGQTGLNIRIGSRPEITFHNLRLKSSTDKIEKTAEAV
ncbi:metallophosphoesterase [Bacillus sp. CMF21]|uniref:metallophosphoesterase n=1 Tax=Metabacillus dongyingensis TaxID=2874282 RepID=UPI001CBB1D1D|nr:metallophosphoesterase [Metabacillus dongyingensis]UAL54601.1 metallophosphoesterase [Metabacillus dongyingensis]UOK59738.1 metallophosphoesterase [Bacillus sp. OVS6]USK30925.1 metallophosphoesterase [Bacillus sp. CMF21]